MKGIILAGGHGTRLDPLTRAISKQLLPVFDKPMVYYPLSMLMLAGIREILVISSPRDLPGFKRLLGDGTNWGINLTYEEQLEPRGIAEAFLLGRNFVGDDSVSLILGDNIFFGATLPERLTRAANNTTGATVFAYQVNEPGHYAVVGFESVTHETGQALTLEEKPKQPQSNYAVPGLYFYDNSVLEIAANLKPSSRGELEITDINLAYLERRQLAVEVLGRGVAWLDAGRPETLLQAANFVQVIQERQGMMISCPEEIAFRRGYIDRSQLKNLLTQMGDNSYREYLRTLL